MYVGVGILYIGGWWCTCVFRIMGVLLDTWWPIRISFVTALIVGLWDCVGDFWLNTWFLVSLVICCQTVTLRVIVLGLDIGP